MRKIAFVLPALLLAACASSGGSDTVKALTSDIAGSARVDEVQLVGSPTNASPEFKDVFVRKVSDKLKTCATGTRPLRMVVEISEFKRANAATTVLVGSSNVIKGSAKLYDPASNELVADYDITRSFGAGGLLGVAMMSQAEEQMSDAFGDEVCKRAFVRR